MSDDIRRAVVCDLNGSVIGYVCSAIHVWRWRLLAIWIILFTVATFWALHSLTDTKADLNSLERTNCGVRAFLIRARDNRLKDGDAEAAATYQPIIALYPENHECKPIKPSGRIR